MFLEVWQRKDLRANFAEVWQGKDLGGKFKSTFNSLELKVESKTKEKSTAETRRAQRFRAEEEGRKNRAEW